MDMASLITAQQLLSNAGSGLTANQQQQLLASMSSSLSQLSATQQQQLLASLAGMTAQPQQQSSNTITGLTPAQQQLLAAAGTSLTSVPSGKDQYSRSSTPSTPTPAGTHRSNNSGTPRPPAANTPNSTPSTIPFVSTNGALDPASQTKYQQLLSVIEEMSKDIRPCYAGSKSSAERLKRGIVYARILVRECLVEAERSARA